MTIDDATLQRVRSIDEVIADLTVELEHLRPTDRRRLKLAAMITVLEDRIASRSVDYCPQPRPIRPHGDAQRGVDPVLLSVDRWPSPSRYSALATALKVLLRRLSARRAGVRACTGALATAENHKETTA